MAAEPLQVDPVLLSAGAERALDHTYEASRGFSSHRDELAAAGDGWVGSSAQALAALTERWQARHDTHLGRVQTNSESLNFSACIFHATEDRGAPSPPTVDPAVLLRL